MTQGPFEQKVLQGIVRVGKDGGGGMKAVSRAGRLATEGKGRHLDNRVVSGVLTAEHLA